MDDSWISEEEGAEKSISSHPHKGKQDLLSSSNPGLDSMIGAVVKTKNSGKGRDRNRKPTKGTAHTAQTNKDFMNPKTWPHLLAITITWMEGLSDELTDEELKRWFFQLPPPKKGLRVRHANHPSPRTTSWALTSEVKCCDSRVTGPSLANRGNNFSRDICAQCNAGTKAVKVMCRVGFEKSEYQG